MSFNISGAAIQPVGSLIPINFGTDGYYQMNFPVNIGSLLTQTGTLTADDQNGNGKIAAGETIDHDNPNIPLIDPIPDLNNATVQGVGYMGGFISGLVVRYPVLLVQSGSSQYLIYPEGRPDLLTAVAGTVNTTLHFYENAQYAPGGDSIPCFARGALIETESGAVAIETLRVGDLVMTKDHGPQPIRWIGSRKMEGVDLIMQPKLRPVRILAGALGAGLPTTDLLVSPQHRVLVRSRIAQKMFGTIEVLVAAKQLVLLEGIDIAEDVDDVEYFHMLFDRHEVVISNGAETESLYTGPEALKSVGKAALDEIFTLFPELADPTHEPQSARPLPSGRQARKMSMRHLQNSRPLLMTDDF